MRAFMFKYLGWDAVKQDVANLYAQYFTVDDLEQLIKFYSTPVGQKMLLITPELTQKSMAIGSQRVKEHMDELKDIIDKASQKAEHEP
jgi:hypothetical protein